MKRLLALLSRQGKRDGPILAPRKLGPCPDGLRRFPTRLMVTAALVLGVTLAGCEAPPYTTPESTFTIYRNAFAQKDWNTALGCLTPQSQDKVVAGLVFGVATASIMNRDAAALLEKHGVDRGQLMGNVMSGALANLADPNAAVEEGMRQCVDAIADKPAFVGDAMGWLEQNNQQVADNFAVTAAAQLSDVQIDGDTATGKLSVPIAGGRTSLQFKKIGGRWLIDL